MFDGFNEQKYRAVVFDVDGTLYDQRRLRFFMARALAAHCLLHPGGLGEVKTLAAFRTWREENGPEQSGSGKGGLKTGQYGAVASRRGVSAETVQNTVEKWMYRAPLRCIARCRDRKMADFIAWLHERGIVTIAYSDYPAEDKLKALGLRMEHCFCATDEDISCLKPDPRGIRTVLRKTGYSAGECLYIGDRDEKDGASARSVGMDYLILPKGARRRNAPGLFEEIRAGNPRG